MRQNPKHTQRIRTVGKNESVFILVNNVWFDLAADHLCKQCVIWINFQLTSREKQRNSNKKCLCDVLLVNLLVECCPMLVEVQRSVVVVLTYS